MNNCKVSTDYERKGLQTIFLENEHLFVEILSEKGGDITKLVDKRTDTNVLFEVPYEWHAPDDSFVGSPDSTFAFMDHYPGGWQNIVPNAGGDATVNGAPFGLHGGAALSPWNVDVSKNTSSIVTVNLSLSMTRYPLELERELTLESGEPTLNITDLIRNVGEVSIPYMWLQHIVFGPPLLDPNTKLEVPCEKVLADPDHEDPNARFDPGTEGDWPMITGNDGKTVDLTAIPPKEARVHDLLALTDLREGIYKISNPKIGLAVEVKFPPELYEYIWYWGAFGGFEGAPFFGRNYNLGLEPSTSIPNAGLEEAIESGTANILKPGKTREADIAVSTKEINSE